MAKVALERAPGPIGVVVLDAAGRVTLAEGASVPQLGSVDDTFRPRPDLRPALAQAMAGEAARIVVPVDGRVLEVSLTPREGGGVLVLASQPDLPEATLELVENQRRLAEAQRVAHVGSFEWDPTTDRVTWSDETYRIYGLRPDAFDNTLQAFLGRVEPADLERTRRVIEAAMRNPGPFVYDHRIVRPDGDVRTLHSRGEVLSDDRGNRRLVGTCWDVTEQRAAEAQLERSRSLLDAALDATADGLLVTTLAGEVTAYNQRLLELWGLRREDVVGHDFDELLDATHGQLSNAAACMQTVRDMQARPEARSMDTLEFVDGRVFEHYSRPQRLAGEIVGRVWSYRDISEREHLLRRTLFLADVTRIVGSLDLQEALYAVVHTAVGHGALAAAVDLVVEGVPRRAAFEATEHALPLGPPRVVDRSAVETVDDCWIATAPLLVQDAPIGAITVAGPRGYVIGPDDLDLVIELARRVGLAVQNARLYKAARDALEARDQLLAIAAHEIRGPLMCIHMAVQTLQQGRLPPERLPQVLALLQREDLRLARLVDEMLDAARIQRRDLRLDVEGVDLRELVDVVVARHAPDAAKAGSTISIDADAIPTGRWDRSRLDQVVSNLLSNAIKFGAGEPITLTVRRHGDSVCLAVHDGGIGIAQDQRERIFQRFERAVSIRHHGGLGLGLHIVRAVVDAMGGRVDVESEVGAGSTFTVELPIAGTA